MICYVHLQLTNKTESRYSGKFFTRSTACRTRGNTMKLKKFHTLSARDGHFFSNRVENVWNSLHDSVILSPTVASFKQTIQGGPKNGLF